MVTACLPAAVAAHHLTASLLAPLHGCIKTRRPASEPPPCLRSIAGALADRYGGKGVLAGGVAIWSLTTILTPPAAYLGIPALIAMRCAAAGEARVGCLGCAAW